MLTVTRSLTAISLSCLEEGLDEEAVEVENRPENRERPRRKAIVVVVVSCVEVTRARNDGMAITRDRRSLVPNLCHTDSQSQIDSVVNEIYRMVWAPSRPCTRLP